MLKSKLKCSNSNPLISVIARNIVIYLKHYKESAKTKQEIADFVYTRSRKELGMSKRSSLLKESTSVRSNLNPFFTKHKKEETLPLINSKNYGKNEKYSMGDTIWNDWRILKIPPHDAVREKTNDLDFILKQKSTKEKDKQNKEKKGLIEFSISLLNPLLPDINVYIGDKETMPNIINGEKGLYFLKHIIRRKEYLYLGETDEFYTRFQDHKKKKEILWWIFLSLDKEIENTYSFDSLHAAEALLISYWNEVAFVSNINRGFDKTPNFNSLQQGIALVQACSSIFIWLIKRNNQKQENLIYKNYKIPIKHWDIPFKKGPKGWSNGKVYLKDFKK